MRACVRVGGRACGRACVRAGRTGVTTECRKSARARGEKRSRHGTANVVAGGGHDVLTHPVVETYAAGTAVVAAAVAAATAVAAVTAAAAVAAANAAAALIGK